MSKRKDVIRAYETGAQVRVMLETAWELGRIAGIKEAIPMVGLMRVTDQEPVGYRQMGSTIEALRAHARKLKARIR